MNLRVQQAIIVAAAGLGLAYLGYEQVGQTAVADETSPLALRFAVPATSQVCVDCHTLANPGIISHWQDSRHAEQGVGCVDCHKAEATDADAFDHYGNMIAAVVTPLDCSRCHKVESDEFQASHHAKGGNILASLDNLLAETVEGSRIPFNPHGPTPGMDPIDKVNGMASAYSGCQQCHGAKVALKTKDGGKITVDDLKPDATGKPTNTAILANVLRNDDGKPMLHEGTWPNTGIGRLNLDGSKGSCSACHSRHDFSRRRARSPENCGKCHLGPDHPQKEIFDESKHGIAFYDLRDKMNLDSVSWILGKDYSAAPSCATCHMSGNLKNDGKVTHDPGERISWTNRPPISKKMDTDSAHKIVTETDPAKRAEQVTDTWQAKRERMQEVCSTCHTSDYVKGFYTQYDDLVILYNEKFAKPGQSIMDVLHNEGLLTKTDFDEEVEWSWYFLWHHEGRRARHGASMMAPDYTHWHGMFEVAERWYLEFIPQAREVVEKARHAGLVEKADKCSAVIEEIMGRTEHKWMKEGDEASAELIRKAMEERYGKEK